MAFGFGFGMPRSFATPFSPASLFATGAPGAWYDPSDINLNWRYNLLTYTEQFDNAAWVKFNTTGNQTEVTANAATAPDGTLTADKVRATTTPNAFLGVAQSSGSAVATTLTLSAYVKPDGMNYVTALVRNGAISGTAGSFVRFDLTNNTAPASGAFGEGYVYIASSATVEQSENGFLRISATFTVPLGGAAFGVFCPSKVLEATSTAVTVGDGIIIWGASLTTAANASLPYQQIVTPEISYLNYQPQPILYQDSAGTTPVTAVEQPVGLMLDKSQGLVLGSELRTSAAVTSGSWTQSGGVVTAPGSSGADNVVFTLSAPTIAGRFYEVAIPNTMPAGSFFADFGSGTGSQVGALGGPFQQRLILTCTAPGSVIRVGRWTGTPSGTIGPISVRELPGNHAFQSTAASRPVLSARVNQLLNTAFAGAVAGSPGTAPTNWSANGTGGSISAVGPETITVTASANRLYLTPTPAYSAAIGSHTSRVVVTAVTAGLLFATLFDVIPGTATSTNTYYANGILVNNGTYVVSAGDVLTIVSSVTVAGTLLYRFGLGPSSPATGTATFTQPDIRVTNVGVNLPAYQRVTTATNYDAVKFPVFLRLDGVDDSLSTNSINFTSTDKMSVFAGVRKLSDATDGVLTELSATVSTNDGSFAVLAPYSSTTNRLGFALRGSAARTNQITGSSPYEAPTTLVLAVRYDTAGTTSATEILPRVNGVVPSTSTAGAADSGTGNFGNYPLYIGRRGGSTVPFNGQLYSMIIVGKAVTTGELSSSETYVNQKTGAY